MVSRRFTAIHTYHSEETRKIMTQWAVGNTTTQKEFMAVQVFENCRTIATWIESNGFFSCHWLAETDEDMHNKLIENGKDQLVFTACYETYIYVDKTCLTDERAFPTRALEAMETAKKW